MSESEEVREVKQSLAKTEAFFAFYHKLQEDGSSVCLYDPLVSGSRMLAKEKENTVQSWVKMCNKTPEFRDTYLVRRCKKGVNRACAALTVFDKKPQKE